MTAPYRWLRAAHKIAPNGALFSDTSYYRSERTERSRPFPTNLPEVRDLPSKFTDSLESAETKCFSGFFALFSSFPHPAAKRPQSRCDRFFPLIRQSSRLPCSVPHRRSFAFLRCSRYSRHAIATDVPCVRPVCKRPGSVSSLCTASFFTLGQAARTEALRCLCAHSPLSPALPLFRLGMASYCRRPTYNDISHI